MRLAAFADCHIGSYGKKLDQETGLNARLLDTAGTLSWLVKDAQARDIHDFLFAGDLFRTAKPTPTELVMALNGLPRGITMISGNHDQPRSTSENTSIDPIRTIADATYNIPGIHTRVGYQLAVLPYPNRAQLAAVLPEYSSLSPEEADRLIGAHLEAILRGLAAELDSSRPSVLLAHISVDSAEVGAERSIMAGRDITIPLHAIPEAFTFVVLGHIHKPQDFGAQGRPNVFYCGSTERIDFGEEQEEKSYCILDLEAGTWERVPIPCRRYKTFSMSIPSTSSTVSIESLEAAKDAICRVQITRPENTKPDYARIQGWVEEAGCWDFRGFSEDIERVSAVRSEEIVKADSLPELLGVWHEAKSCPVPLEDLQEAAGELERSVPA